MTLTRSMSAAALLACIAVAQQPNTSVASMTIDGNNGIPFPIQMNVRTNAQSLFTILGSFNQPFVIVASGNGSFSVGSATYFGGHYDLPLSPPFQMCISGAQDPTFRTDITGQYTFPILCPPPGTAPSGIPLGFHVAYQGAVGDPFNPAGWSLTAATRCTVTQGPTVVYMQTGINYYGDSLQYDVNFTTFGMVLPFYGVNYTLVHISGDGYMTFGGSQVPDYTATDYDMTTGPPRIAGFWTDLDQYAANQICKYTVDPSPPGSTPYLLVEFINMPDAVSGNNHNFNWRIDTAGNVTIAHLSNNNPSIYDVLVGIGPGNNLNPQPSRNLSAWLQPAAHVGGVNESMYEWFGIISQNPYYTLPVDDPYDLPGRTMHWIPSGPGTSPTFTNQYTLY